MKKKKKEDGIRIEVSRKIPWNRET